MALRALASRLVRAPRSRATLICSRKTRRLPAAQWHPRRPAMPSQPSLAASQRRAARPPRAHPKTRHQSRSPSPSRSASLISWKCPLLPRNQQSMLFRFWMLSTSVVTEMTSVKRLEAGRLAALVRQRRPRDSCHRAKSQRKHRQHLSPRNLPLSRLQSQSLRPSLPPKHLRTSSPVR